MQQSTMDMVTEFHQTFEPEAIRATPGLCDKKYLDFRIDFLKEEWKELRYAVDEQDKVEICDALGDMRYVLYGLLLNCGVVNLSDHESAGMRQVKAMEERMKFIDDCVDGFAFQLDVLDSGRTFTDIIHCADILDRILDDAEKSEGLQDVMPAVIAEIHRSNMTKCCTDRKQADDSCILLNEEHGICSVYEVGDRFVVRRLSDGKIVKPIGYEKPNLAAVLEAHISITDPR